MFGDAICDQDRPVHQVDWRIPAGGGPTAVRALTLLYGRHAGAIDAANREVVRRLEEGVPQLVRMATIGDVPGYTGRTLLHCGPPIAYGQACDPLQRSMRAGTVAEGWAADVAEADALLERGEIALDAANHHDTVVPMASAVGPSQPVFVVANAEGGTQAFSPVSQGPGEVPWFGRDTDAAIARLRFFLSDVAGPALTTILSTAGPLDVLATASQGITMGDDLHMRTQAATNLLTRAWLPHIAALPDGLREPFAGFLSRNHLFFLNLAMAGAKSLQLHAEQVQGSSIVTTMSRNGRRSGSSSRGRRSGTSARPRPWARCSTTPGSAPGRVPAPSGTARCWS